MSLEVLNWSSHNWEVTYHSWLAKSAVGLAGVASKKQGKCSPHLPRLSPKTAG